jgi:hypothetical protein
MDEVSLQGLLNHVDPPAEDEASHRVAVILTLCVPMRGKVERCLNFHVHGELGNQRPFSFPAQKRRCWQGMGAHQLFLIPHNSQRPLALLLPWHFPSAFMMDPGKRPAGDTSRDRWSMWHHLMRVG